MRDEINEYQRFNVNPFGINPAAAEKHAAYVERLKLPFVLLSDPKGTIARAYHAALPWGTGVTRTVYLIGRDGAILFGQRGAPGATVSLAALSPP